MSSFNHAVLRITKAAQKVAYRTLGRKRATLRLARRAMRMVRLGAGNECESVTALHFAYMIELYRLQESVRAAEKRRRRCAS